MPHLRHYRAEHELSDGRILRLEYDVKVYPATMWEPEDYDYGEPYLTVDGQAIEQSIEEVDELLIETMMDNATRYYPNQREDWDD